MQDIRPSIPQTTWFAGQGGSKKGNRKAQIRNCGICRGRCRSCSYCRCREKQKV